MPAITDRFDGQPLIKTTRIGHGTLECLDITKTRQFYEEVFGFDVLQTSHRSLMIRLGTGHTYAVVETGREGSEMNMLNHNGLDVDTPEDVDAAYQKLLEVQDKYGIKKIQAPRHSHGDSSFYFCDRDGNWWEVVSVRAGGYAADYEDDDRDLTGLHQFDELKGNVNFVHTHDPEFRAQLRTVLGKSSGEATP
jgi:catechol 2,3-dioxygenase-like lactoylglutathione lyase family enzyme